MTNKHAKMCIEITSNNPFLDNKETFGMNYGECEIGFTGFTGFNASEVKEVPDFKRRTNANRRRGVRISRKAKQKEVMYQQINEYLVLNSLPIDQLQFLTNLRYSISNCCHHTLFREFEDGTKEFIGAHTCKHRLCPVCNGQRSKKTRKVYRKFFEADPELMNRYDFMHLTLTVPHNGNGWRGKEWYAEELIREFNYMRKKPFWKAQVYAGEFGIEVTKNAQGLHIHIHALLLVYKARQNRNYLHRDILKAWNRQTKGSNRRRKLRDEEIQAILKGNSLFADSDVHELFPSGSTFIGLESLYLQSKDKKPGYHWCERSGAWKKYVTPADGQQVFMAGIMECIKYHFEPMAMKKDGQFDFDLICEILPAIKGKPLYRKFGAFHASTKNAHPNARMLSLSFKEEDTITELAEELEEHGREEITHPETGETVPREGYRYFLTSLSKVYFDPEDDLKIKLSPGVRIHYLKAQNVFDALVDMELIAMAHQARKKNPLIIKKSKYHA